MRMYPSSPMYGRKISRVPVSRNFDRLRGGGLGRDGGRQVAVLAADDALRPSAC